MLTLKFKKLNDRAIIPHFASTKAACFDLTANRIEINPRGDKAKIYFGLAAEIPEGYQLEISPRSSFCHKDWVMQNSPGQVDSDYKGELMMFLQAIPISISDTIWGDLVGSILVYPKLPYQVGERVAQCKLVKVEQYTIEETQELSTSERGEGGFGSTGKSTPIPEQIGSL